MSEVLDICDVQEEFVFNLERERLVRPVMRGGKKMYPPSQVDRIRVAHLLIGELGVNIEGVEVVLHLRAQIIRMRREIAQRARRSPLKSGE